MSKQKQSENAGKKCVEEKWIEKKPKKRGWNENEEKQIKEDQSRIGLSHGENDPWSDHLETQFEPTYPFFETPT